MKVLSSCLGQSSNTALRSGSRVTPNVGFIGRLKVRLTSRHRSILARVGWCAIPASDHHDDGAEPATASALIPLAIDTLYALAVR